MRSLVKDQSRHASSLRFENMGFLVCCTFD
jgi:hypothetical protein